MITQVTYELNAYGQPRIYDPALAGASVTVLSVKRENQRKYSSGGNPPTNSEYRHDLLGFLVFSYGASGEAEKVTVIYKS